MISYQIIISISVIVLVAYSFEQLSKRLLLPSVIFLLALGIGLQFVAKAFDFDLPFVSTILPVLGTVGLLLIVLEGALELELRNEKKVLILMTLLTATIGLLSSVVAIGAFFHYFLDLNWKVAIINAIPLSVISSAIAIPSAKHLKKDRLEFITYESTFSDILGVLLFAILGGEAELSAISIGAFGLNFLVTCLSAIIISLLLVWYLDKVEHHVKFLPIFFTLLLVYGVAKYFHSSPLVIALIFGLCLNNTRLFIRGKMKRFFRSDNLESDLHHFTLMSAEAVFLIKSLFFILFGFSIPIGLLLEWRNIEVAIAVVAIIVILRWMLTKWITPSKKELMFFGPRGLITLLLFLSIPESMKNAAVNEGVVTAIVLLTILFLLPGSWMKPKA